MTKLFTQKKPTNRLVTFLAIWFVCTLPAFYQFYLQLSEDRYIESYMETTGLQGLPVSQASAIEVSKVIRSQFNVDRHAFKYLKLSRQPFLRKDAEFLLRHKEGLCGEGARVIISILSKLGFDATRVTLFNKNLHSSHIVVSVLIDGKEYFIDTINTSPRLNSFLVNNRISTENFKIVEYIDDIEERIKTARQANNPDSNLTATPGYELFFGRFWLYSYESIPVSKLLSALGLNIRAFNLDRPPKILSILAEKPHLIMAVLLLLISLLVSCLIYLAIHLWYAKQRRNHQ